MDAQLLEDVKSCLETGRLQLLIGWCKGTMVNERGEVCALGAIACNGKPVPYSVFFILKVCIKCKQRVYKVVSPGGFHFWVTSCVTPVWGRARCGG